MKFNSRQILLVAITAVIIVTLFVMGYKTPFGQNGSKGVSVLTKEFDEAGFLSEQKAKLSPAVKQRVETLEADGKNKENLAELAGLWDSLNVGYAGAYYAMKAVEAAPSETGWYAAGMKFYNVANFSSDSAMTYEAVKHAKEAYSKALEMNPQNLQAKTALAVCVIQGDNDVMKGVGMLKEVVAVDSNNIQAIFTLGMLSIQSGQLDKAAERFEKLVKLEPFNPEYYYYLGQVYAQSGKKEKAIKTYETCKTLVKDNEAKKEIESIINKLK